MMKRKRTIQFLLLSVILVLLLGTAVHHTQAQDESQLWIGPRLLSNPGINETSETEMVADRYGILHVFWTETDPDDATTTIQYATFDGIAWTESLDIYITAPDIDMSSFSVAIDDEARLHLAWTEGNVGPVLYMNANVLEARSARNWSDPITMQFPAYRLKLQVDSKGVLHLMFINFYGREPGVYYTRSEDEGENWTQPLWLDPDIPTYDTPNVLKFLLDDNDGLHASWYYAALDLSSPLGEWVRYTRSLDGGENWDSPVTIDRADETIDELRQPYPGLAVAGDTVHVVYAGNATTQREHSYSLDRGETWTEPERVLGDLQGQALGDGMATDGRGRVHFLGQIRWPQGVYHAVWDPAQPESGWTEPKMGYKISSSPEEGREGRYHAHSVRAAVLNGNILISTFTDEAVGPLYVMWRTLDDVEPITPLSTPTPTPLPEPTATPEPEATLVPTQPPFADSPQAVPEDTPNAGRGLWIGLIPTVILVLAVFGFQIYRMRQ